MKDIDQCTRRPRPTLTIQSTPILMRKNFRRGRLPLCRTTALRLVHSTQLMAGRDIVTNICYDKGRFREPSFVSIGIGVFSSVCRPNGRSFDESRAAKAASRATAANAGSRRV